MNVQTTTELRKNIEREVRFAMLDNPTQGPLKERLYLRDLRAREATIAIMKLVGLEVREEDEALRL